MSTSLGLKRLLTFNAFMRPLSPNPSNPWSFTSSKLVFPGTDEMKSPITELKLTFSISAIKEFSLLPRNGRYPLRNLMNEALNLELSS
ncbi:hypothetical protein WICPIJ_004822 [Wickerhamomyces pijperi]|uniref:Uncharacterized protein n=1 Tax=Wickerhamomyces pijperi TaxID=599730 RepID=A0A9P8Q7B5_WICPI|nr:hypothetical protein WICPIJ_004822 [Wickerhamomyces pijperi]